METCCPYTKSAAHAAAHAHISSLYSSPLRSLVPESDVPELMMRDRSEPIAAVALGPIHTHLYNDKYAVDSYDNRSGHC